MMAPANPVIIKKYGNRRLYDTSGSRYVNLDEIAALIRAGQHVQVVDAASGKDLTRLILTQIITEDAKQQPGGLPLEFLRQLVVASDRMRREFMMWYLKSASDAYERVQDAMHTRFSEMQAAVSSPLQTMRRLLGMEPEPPRPAEADEMEALRRRVSELEARLAQASRPAARKPRAAAAKKRASRPRKTSS
jgi:polyhydroxyalkanoate synthesis repressor PhaR